MERRELARRIYKIAHLTGQFTLRSGVTTTEYFDKYRFEADPALLCAVAEALVPLLPAGVDALAGLELGGVPLAAALSLETGLPALYVRKAAKAYGTGQLAEGGRVDRKLVVIEDVVTSGGQIAISTGDLRALGAKVDTAVCVIDRESGGTEKLRAEGIELRPLFTMSELLEAGATSGSTSR